MNDLAQIARGPGYLSLIVLVFAVVVSIGVFTGCDGDPEPTPFVPNSSSSNDNGDDHRDAGTDADADGDTDDGEDATDDVIDDDDDGNDGNDGNNDDEDEFVDGPCGTMVDLGELAFGQQTLTVDFDDFDNDLSAGCGNGAGGSAGIYQFQTPAMTPGMLTIDAGGEAVAELRVGLCDNEDQSVGCDQESVSVVPQVNVFHNLIVEPLDGSDVDSVDIELQFDELAECVDADGNQVAEKRECLDNSTLEACQFLQASPDVSREFTISCPTGECTDDRCAGDHCDNPISVSSSFDWIGTTIGFFQNYDSLAEAQAAQNAGQAPTCVTADNDSIQTYGNDLFFELEDLSQGDEVAIHIDAEFPDQLVVFVKEDCSDTGVCNEVWVGESAMFFEAPSDGDFYIVVSSTFDNDAMYTISIDINAD